MNCEYFEGEFDPIVFDPTYSPDVDDACQARNEGEFPCESAQLESEIKLIMILENFLFLFLTLIFFHPSDFAKMENVVALTRIMHHIQMGVAFTTCKLTRFLVEKVEQSKKLLKKH